jgi:hypothetical protein
MPSTTFCPSCGAEYLAGVVECSDCHVPLGAQPAGTAGPIVTTTTADAGEGEDDGDGEGDGDEIVYDLADWGQQDRTQLELLLTGSNVTHRWEVGSDLVILEGDADAVEALMDEIEGVAGVPPLPMGDEEDGGDDEATYAVMSDLFVAADRLQKDPADPAAAGDFFVAADAAAVTPAPFGIDRPEWQQVQEVASSLAAAIESDVDDDVIARDASTLRAMLARYV